MAANDIARVRSFSISGVASDAFVFVNILGDNVDLSGNYDAFKAFTANNSTRVLFNLPGAANLSLQNLWLDAAVLAPNATISHSSGHINGPLHDLPLVVQQIDGNFLVEAGFNFTMPS
ncbi:hypothetical protein GCM10011289_21300 [Paludibacterium paludis]|uniref:Choice-of-anchor A domain-containing protein n=1 Tax=Paludibacterium paludis TaxID=1225769 RepID=A0A918P3N8_9NEIS|nr:hypothetical protein GCM10011289_21300 [Paludibacterium paludis]